MPHWPRFFADRAAMYATTDSKALPTKPMPPLPRTHIAAPPTFIPPPGFTLPSGNLPPPPPVVPLAPTTGFEAFVGRGNRLADTIAAASAGAMIGMERAGPDAFATIVVDADPDPEPAPTIGSSSSSACDVVADAAAPAIPAAPVAPDAAAPAADTEPAAPGLETADDTDAPHPEASRSADRAPPPGGFAFSVSS